MTDYETKDSGERAQFPSGMQRDTQKGKPRWDLLLPLNVPYEDQLLTRLAALMARGAEKYDPRNWEKANSVEELERMKGSAFRHMMQWLCGETDEDHAAGAIFNILAAETTRLKVKPEAEEPVVEESYCFLDGEGDWWMYGTDGWQCLADEDPLGDLVAGADEDKVLYHAAEHIQIYGVDSREREPEPAPETYCMKSARSGNWWVSETSAESGWRREYEGAEAYGLHLADLEAVAGIDAKPREERDDFGRPFPKAA